MSTARTSPASTRGTEETKLDAAVATEAEQRALREGCGLLDRCQRGKLALTGAGAAEFLNGQVSNDVERLADGEGCYAAFLTHKGKMLGDLRILRTPSELLLDTERVALQALFDMIRRFKIGYDAELHKRTLERALLSLIGPRAREVTATALDAPAANRGAVAAAAAGLGSAADDLHELPALTEHAHRTATIAGCAVRLIATARPDGVDVLCETDDRDAVQAALLAAGAQPVSEAAAEVLRVELGVPRYGVDLDESVIPQEAGLNERAVSFTKGCYVGQETVARLHYKGRPNRLLRGLCLSEAASTGEEILHEGRVVGRLGSVAVSPALGPIALALVRREAPPGTSVVVGERAIEGTVIELPFATAPSAAVA